MDNSIIKLMLENRKARVYSLIVQMYFEKVELHKASVFKIWLAKELGISSDLIHVSSISAALARHKKRLVKTPKRDVSRALSTPERAGSNDFDTDIPEVFPGFK
jgi:hypothetical protein